MNLYQELIKTSQEQGWIPRYEFIPHYKTSLRMTHGSEPKHPFSITFPEFEYIKSYIKLHELKIGYDLATAFGISSLAAALGMKGRGKILTMDCYIEEYYGKCDLYHGKKETYPMAMGFKSLINLIVYFNLQNILVPSVGRSPENVPAILNQFLNKEEKLDYIFVDAEHTVECVLNDIKAIIPFLNKNKFAIFLHDGYCGCKEIIEFSEKKFNICPKLVLPDGDNFGLGVITNI